MKRLFLMILSAVLVLSICTPGVSVSVAAAENEKVKEASGLLSALEIMPEGYNYEINSGMKVTRAGFLMMVMKAMKIPAAENDQFVFTDVDPKSGEAKYISTSAAMGLVNGFGDGTFRPDAEISVTDCLKIAVEAAGYGEIAKGSGGYPLGYIAVADSQGISKGVGGYYDSGALMDDARLIVYNMLHADWVLSYEVNGIVRGSSDSDRSILNVLYDIYKASGIVTGTEETRLSAAAGVKEEHIEIGGELYRQGSEADKELLGYAVDFYYESADDGDTKTLVYVVPRKSNDDLVYDAREIDQFANRTYTFWDGAKRVTETVPSAADIIYNGRALLGNIDDARFVPDTGSVTLIDNNNDGTFDVVKIIDKQTIVIDSVDTEKYIMYDRIAGAGVTLLLDDSGSFCSITDPQGHRIAFEDIARNDVVEAVISDDGLVAKLVVCKRTVDGTLEETSGTFDDMSYTVNGNSYSLNPDFAASLAESGSRPQLNGSYRFLLTGDNEIAWFELSGSGETGRYACLIQAADEGNNIDTKVMLKVLTTEDQVAILECANKLKVNGSGMIQDAAALSLIQPLLVDGETGGMKPLVIYYETNGDGKINYIETPNAPDPITPDTALHLAGIAVNTYHTVGAESIGGKVTYDSETVLFMIPRDMENMEDKDMRAVKIRGYAYEAQIFERVEGYAREKNAVISRVALSRETAGDRYDRSLFMLTGVTKAIDADGEEKYKLRGLRNGTPAEYVVSEDDVYTNPQPYEGIALPKQPEKGDLLRLVISPSNEVTQIAVVYSPANDAWYLAQNPTDSGIPFEITSQPVENLSTYYSSGGGHYRAVFRIFAANVYSKTGTHIRAINSMYDLSDPKVAELVDSGAIGIENHKANEGNIFVYRPQAKDDVYVRGNIGSITSFKDQSAASKVIIYTDESIPAAIIVYP